MIRCYVLDVEKSNYLKERKTIVVGMSGGVDSSVVALLLKNAGHHVIGLFMKNWEELDENGICQSSKDFSDVARVCDKLGIPYYSVDFTKEYQSQVFSHFIEEYRQGFTPNPDILCNREIKFKVFFDKAMDLGADYLATGHYCQRDFANGEWSLLKGVDPGKDQSYFLYTIKKEILEKVLFPIGHLYKKEVRALAQAYGLATKDKKDSTGICFIGERNFKKFLGQYIVFTPGPFLNLSGEVVGEHTGAAYYTIGQRKGLGLGGPGAPWFVVGKDIAKNVVFVERGENHPALFSKSLVATDISLVSDNKLPITLSSLPFKLPFACKAKIRYRQIDQDCILTHLSDNGELTVEFLTPQRAITPRQSIVFYFGDICLGGAIIKSFGPTLYEAKATDHLPNILDH